MRTPEEIKKGLECCDLPGCKGEECPYNDDEPCHFNLHKDALAYIQQLERERDEARNDLDTLSYANTELHSAYEAMKRERDAAVEQLKEVDRLELFCCSHCKHEELDDFSCTTCIHMSNWEWIGVQGVE